MHVTCEDCGTAVLVTVTAPRFDTTSAGEAREVMREFLRDDRQIYLVDLAKVSFVDSFGIGVLVGFLKFAGKDRRVELCGLTAPVKKVFRLTNLLNVFTIHQSVEDGLLAHRATRAKAAG